MSHRGFRTRVTSRQRPITEFFHSRRLTEMFGYPFMLNVAGQPGSSAGGPVAQNFMHSMGQDGSVHMFPYVMPNMGQQMPGVPTATVGPSPPIATSDFEARVNPDDHGFQDDEKKVSSSYKALGLLWKYCSKRVTTISFRASLCAACDRREFPMAKIVMQHDEYVDMLVFVVVGWFPSVKPIDTGARTKGQVRTLAKEQYESKIKKTVHASIV